jgi:predicted PolB exonuclease-like 3'-5' exonuclease
MIKVEKTGDEIYKVTVKSVSTTSHTVTLSDSYYQKLTGGKMTPEELIKKSFEFLLEREPNTSILRSFELPVIGRYFPEYEQVIGD